VTIDQSGEKTVLAPTGAGDNLVLAWPSDSDAVWYETGWLGGQTIQALSSSGAERTVQRVPANLRLFDVSRDGRVLANRVNWRVAINCLAPGQTAERDLSWFDASRTAVRQPRRRPPGRDGADTGVTWVVRAAGNARRSPTR
jgi:hypothetical protein